MVRKCSSRVVDYWLFVPAPVQVFSERYLTQMNQPEVEETLELDDDEEESEEDIQDDDNFNRLSKIIERHVLNDACLEHLRHFVTLSSPAMELYHQQKWSALSVNATSGIIRQSHQVPAIFKVP